MPSLWLMMKVQLKAQGVDIPLLYYLSAEKIGSDPFHRKFTLLLEYYPPTRYHQVQVSKLTFASFSHFSPQSWA
jgi:hypothetical protein